MIEIVSRWDKAKVLYRAETATDVRAAVVEARREGANLGYADLGGADLWDADLRGADLRSADLRGAKGGPIMLHGLPSGTALLHLADEVWQVTVGCWTGTPDELETLIAGDEWPETDGVEQEKRRPALTALVALARAHIAYTEAAGKEAGNE